MNRFGIAAIFGAVGISVGWLTRPAFGGSATALSIEQLYSQIIGPADPGLAAGTQATLLHVGMFFLSCTLLGYVAARLSDR
ncbi:MAG: hypothetical protein WDN31_12875 [Hyphomicrobium sp.]